MRRIVILALALSPVLAHSQSSSSALQTAPAANLQARAGAAPALNHAEPTTTNISLASHPLRNIVSLQIEPTLGRDIQHNDGSITYTFEVRDRNSVTSFTSPVLLHVVNIGVDHLASNDADIFVHMTVDEHGIPTNLKVSHSASAELDRKTLAAVSQYRFTPATYDRSPVDANVTVDVKVVK